MKLFARFNAILTHDDPLTAACNRISHLVAWNQPLYPIYVWWLVGGDWWISFWTFLSTPLFACVPIVARRNALAGRAMLPLTGVANGIISVKAFGQASGVALFLVPCALIAVLGFRGSEWRTMAALIAVICAASFTSSHAGSPLGRFSPDQYRHFLHLDIYSVTGLSIVVIWSLIRARASTKPPVSG